MKKTPWIDYIPPSRIFGNLYFIGTRSASTHIIDTGDGLIMIDSGYPHSLYIVIDGLHRMGFKIDDVKYIIHSHGHYDHMGATKAITSLCTSKVTTFIGAADKEYAEGTLDLSWAKELGTIYSEAFTPDVLLSDGDKISLGKTVIDCIATPGHTPGCMSFFFDVTDGERTFRAGMHGGVGINSMRGDFLRKYGLSFGCREEFIKGLRRVRNERAELFLGNHVGNNDTEGKLAKLRLRNTSTNPFIDESCGEWQRFIDSCENKLYEMIESERNQE